MKSLHESSHECSIHYPRHNIREIIKQILLIEGHLNQKNRFCEDCLRKHMMSAESLAEEAISLDVNREFSNIFDVLPEVFRGFQRMVEEGVDSRIISKDMRIIRKKLFSLV